MNETPRKKKVDITSKVTGKIREDQMILNVEEREIGRMSLDTTSPRYQFNDGFGLEENKIYQIQVEGQENDQYVEGCDMGWC
jgi:hypothetical protein